VTNFFLVANPAFPARNMKDWIEVVRKNPGKYSYASSGNGSPQHIFMELLKKQLGLNIIHVPYKGSNTSMVDLLSGQVDMSFIDGTLAIPHLNQQTVCLGYVHGQKNGPCAVRSPHCRDCPWL
jgi:tripartite-type tricarboxylate transporter receptor subunit TctC